VKTKGDLQPSWDEVISRELFDLEKDPFQPINEEDNPELEDVANVLSQKLRSGWRSTAMISRIVFHDALVWVAIRCTVASIELLGFAVIGTAFFRNHRAHLQGYKEISSHSAGIRSS
jgi:hypothetical protein